MRPTMRTGFKTTEQASFGWVPKSFGVREAAREASTASCQG